MSQKKIEVGYILQSCGVPETRSWNYWRCIDLPIQKERRREEYSMGEMAAVVSWYGPYSDIDDARRAAACDYGAGLYAAFGYERGSARGRPRFLYVGAGSPLYTRLTVRHHQIGIRTGVTITSIWLGEISSHKRPGPRPKKIEPLIDAVEWAMIALLRPCRNQRKLTFPVESLAIINRWWRTDYETPMQKPAMIWPDVIECSGAHAPAYLCWLEQQKVRKIYRPRGSLGLS